ncbi:Lysophospholipase 1 [Puccinia graminis f. sp. tritici]|uniref:Lysophospholipase n=1 Tax=Puccinia graminis f. sp. tritici TaxID=56615 RepID=A0A5B0LZA2_PUCGR|nr:Lysophospholipase 1 [Puccinia graminis f. sp. tritici]
MALSFSSILSIYCLLLLQQSSKVTSQVLTASVPSYAPVSIECPSSQNILRLAGSSTSKNQTLSQGEAGFRRGRKSVTAPLWRDFFINGPGKSTGYKSTALVSQKQNDWPVLGIAYSGGGIRAALYAAGVMQALDARTSASPIRGIFQLSSYFSGLSGGSWLVASAAASNFPIASELVSGWELEKDLVLPGGINAIRSAQFIDQIHDTSKLKKDAGYNISLTDLWGRALGYHFLPGTTSDNFYTNSPTTAHGAGDLISGLRNMKTFQEFRAPLPILVSDHKPLNKSESNTSSVPASGSTYIPLSAPVYECSPFEFGSFDPQLSAFIPSELLGTSLSSGKPFIPSSVNKSSKPDPNKRCVRGFDQLSFIMGSSATLFNAVTGVPAKYNEMFKKMIQKIADTALDRSFTARYPNPFRGVNGAISFDRSKSDELVIVDGGENGENIPLNPLLAPARQVDVILAADASGDSNSSSAIGAGWPNGKGMINTFLRVHKVLPAGTSNFPSVPLNPTVWEEKGYSSRPTFFGCNVSSKEGNGGYPLVIYLPNSPSQTGYLTNTSTFKLQYSREDSSSFLQSVMESTTKPRIENKVDKDWSTCLSCGLIDRSRNRLGITRSTACEICFKRYCYA